MEKVKIQLTENSQGVRETVTVLPREEIVKKIENFPAQYAFILAYSQAIPQEGYSGVCTIFLEDGEIEAWMKKQQKPYKFGSCCIELASVYREKLEEMDADEIISWSFGKKYDWEVITSQLDDYYS